MIKRFFIELFCFHDYITTDSKRESIDEGKIYLKCMECGKRKTKTLNLRG